MSLDVNFDFLISAEDFQASASAPSNILISIVISIQLEAYLHDALPFH